MRGGFLSVMEGNNRAILVEVCSMADIDEKGERRLVGTERQTLQAQPDAQAARHAGASDVKAVQALNRNAHNGSAGGDQNVSLELVAFKDQGGYDLLAAREMPEVKEKAPSKKNEPEALTADFLRGKAQGGDIWARSFLPEIDKAERLPVGPIRDQELENVLKKAAVIFRPEGQVKAEPKPVEENQSQTSTGAIISRQAEKNPVLAPVKAHYDWTNKLEPGPERDKHRQLAREQLVQAEPQAKAELERLDRRRLLAEQEDCGVHEMPNGPKEVLKGQVQYPEREIEGVRRLTPEDLQKLAKAFEAGPGAAQASINETSGEILRRTGESTRDTVLAGIKLVVGLLEYDRDLVINPEKARKQAAEAGEALGVLVVAGVSITAGGVGYADQVSKSGDYSLPLKHISEGVNRWYNRQSPADQMAIVAEVSAGFGLSAGAVEANKLRKPGAFMEFLKEGLESLPKNPEAERKAIEAISKLFRRAEPVADTGTGVIVHAGDAVREAQEKGLGDHIMAMVQYFEHGNKKPISAEKAAEKAKVTKKELRQMTEDQLEAHGLESIQKSYDRLFFSKYPHLKDTGVVVHHALPQKLLDKHAGLFKAKEVNSIEYLRGVPLDATIDGKWVHDIITARWERFLPNGKAVTRQQVLDELQAIDKDFGRFFVPPR